MIRTILRSAALAALLFPPLALPAACGPVYGADGIAVDKNGDVWLAHYEDVRLGRLTPQSGYFEEYLPTTASSHESVTTRDTWNTQDGFSYRFDFGFYALAVDDSRDAVWAPAFNSDKVMRFSRSDRLFAEAKLPGRVLGRFTLPVDGQGNAWALAEVCCDSKLELVKIDPKLEQRRFPLDVKKPRAAALAVSKDGGTAWVSAVADGADRSSLFRWQDGRFQVVALPAELDRPISRLHADANGDLWMAAGNAIWQLHGQSFVRHVLPAGTSAPSVMASDNKGKLWFTEWNANKIGVLAGDGSIREYALPPEEQTPMALALGGDGAVWFSTMFNYDLFRLDPDSGRIKSFPLPVPANWSANAASGLSACTIKSKDAAAPLSTNGALASAAAATPLRHAKAYPGEQGAIAFEKNCHTACHSWYRVDKAAQRRKEWRPTVERMIEFNKAAIVDSERELIIDHLNRHYTMAAE